MKPSRWLRVVLFVLLAALFACGGDGGGGAKACETLVNKVVSCCGASPTAEQRKQAIDACMDQYKQLSSEDKKAFEEEVGNLTCDDIRNLLASQGVQC